MSKVNCEAVGKRRQASLRMARAELLRFFEKSVRLVLGLALFLWYSGHMHLRKR